MTEGTNPPPESTATPPTPTEDTRSLPEGYARGVGDFVRAELENRRASQENTAEKGIDKATMTSILTSAEKEYADYKEKKLGHPDINWENYYAAHMSFDLHLQSMDVYPTRVALLLKNAESAYTEYATNTETSGGQPEEWQSWYADYMLQQLNQSEDEKGEPEQPNEVPELARVAEIVKGAKLDSNGNKALEDFKQWLDLQGAEANLGSSDSSLAEEELVEKGTFLERSIEKTRREFRHLEEKGRERRHLEEKGRELDHQMDKNRENLPGYGTVVDQLQEQYTAYTDRVRMTLFNTSACMWFGRDRLKVKILDDPYQVKLIDWEESARKETPKLFIDTISEAIAEVPNKKTETAASPKSPAPVPAS